MTPAAASRSPDLPTLFRAFARLTLAHMPQEADPPWDAMAQPLPSGVLRVRVARRPGDGPAVILDLLPNRASHEPAFESTAFGDMVIREGAGSDALAARTAVANACGRLASDPRFAPLRRVLPTPPDAHHMMDTILARRLEIGVTRCGGFVFSQADEEIGRLCRLGFVEEATGNRLTFVLLGPALHRDDTELTAGPFQLVMAHGVADRMDEESRDEPSLEKLPGSARTLVQVVRFLLARSLGPTVTLGGPWAPAAPPPAPGLRDLGSTDGLNASTLSAEAAWRRFFVPFEAERDLLGDIRRGDSWGRIRFLMHGELECCHIQPRGEGRIHHHRPLLRAQPTPPPAREHPDLWTRLVAAGRCPPGPEAPSSFPAMEVFESEEIEPPLLMDDREVILGASEMLESRLRWEREHAREGDVLIFNETCVPRIMGEDLQRVMRAHVAQGGAPLMALDIAQQGPFETLARLVREMRDIVLARTTVAQAGIVEDGVALVGYPEDGSREELDALLAAMGLRCTTTFLPSLGRESLMETLRARYVLCHPGPAWQRIVAALLAGEHTRILAPPLPYGFTGVRRFVEAVASGTTRPPDPLLPLLERAEKVLRVDVRPPLGVAYVTDFAEARRLALTDGNFGIPALPFLDDLGFSQTLLVHVPGDAGDPEEALARVRRHIADAAGDARIPVRPFSTVDDLRGLLADASFQAVYSQMTFDRRLYASGKAAFSMADLECGLWGAHRTARRLADRCGWAGPARWGAHVREKGWNA